MDEKVPQSPEDYSKRVRDELDQTGVTHQGEAREQGDRTMDDHLGAVETEPTPIIPPMDSPDHLIEGNEDDAGIEPREELHGG